LVEGTYSDHGTSDKTKDTQYFVWIKDNAHSFESGLWQLLRIENKVRPETVQARFRFLSLIVSSVVAHKNDILKRLVLEAKREYEKDAENRVHIFTADE
jgi:hypothetical protein